MKIFIKKAMRDLARNLATNYFVDAIQLRKMQSIFLQIIYDGKQEKRFFFFFLLLVTRMAMGGHSGHTTVVGLATKVILFLFCLFKLICRPNWTAKLKGAHGSCYLLYIYIYNHVPLYYM